MPELAYRAVTPDEPIELIARLPALAFGVENDKSAEWFEQRVGRENVRVAVRGEDILGCVGRVPMGLYLGGREVAQLGVLGVAVAPEARGMGVARRMMADCVREMHADGYPLSALYSAMHPLYRSAGYETAGLLLDATIPAGMIEPVGPRMGDDSGWREVTEADLPAIGACYAAYARPIHGMLARTEYIWRRIRESRYGLTRGFLSEDPAGVVDAYCFYVQAAWSETDRRLGTSAGSEMKITDAAWSSPRGFANLLGFLRGFASMVGEIRVTVPPGSPLLLALPDRRYGLRVRDSWMLRVLDVSAALEQRGYPAGLTAELTLEIEDDLIEANSGRWLLRVRDGSCEVTRGGRDEALRCGVREFAAIYTGHAKPAALRGVGRVACDDRTAEVAGTVFGGSQPAMVDMF